MNGYCAILHFVNQTKVEPVLLNLFYRDFDEFKIKTVIFLRAHFIHRNHSHFPSPGTKHFLQSCMLRYQRNRNRMLYKHFLPKNPVDFFLHSRKTKAVVLVKEPDKNREKFFFIFKMAHFTSQNGPFCSAK